MISVRPTMLPSQKTGAAQQKFTIRYKPSRKCKIQVGPESRNEHHKQGSQTLTSSSVVPYLSSRSHLRVSGVVAVREHLKQMLEKE